MTNRVGNVLVPAYLCLCLLLGGASSAGLWANTLLQLLAIPILLWAALPRKAAPLSRAGRQLLVIMGLMLLVAAVQLVPLPPAIWSALPGRDHVAEAFRVAGQPLPWLPISLYPYATIASLLWLLPALAILLALLRRGIGEPALFGWALVAVMAAAVLVGAMQIAGGRDSPLYFYQITNPGVTVGFFSNANHMATLLLVALPFLAAIYAVAVRKGRNKPSTGPLVILLISAFGLVAVGLVINGSLAGLGLMLPVALASLLMLLIRRKLPRWAVPTVALVTAASLAVVLLGPFDNNLFGDVASTSSESRAKAFGITLAAAMDYLPFGSGVGTFQSVYPMYEVPVEVTRTYMNHAHSDYIELFLETGIAGLVLILLFLLWWGRQTMQIWRLAEPNHFARAATIASGAILAHSVVDYPLRTVAISAVFAVCCALMATPGLRPGRSAPARESRPARHLTAD